MTSSTSYWYEAQKYPEGSPNNTYYLDMASSASVRETNAMWEKSFEDQRYADARAREASVREANAIWDQQNVNACETTYIQRAGGGSSGSTTMNGFVMLLLFMFIFIVPVISWIIVLLLFLRSDMLGVCIIMIILSATMWSLGIWILFF